MSLRNKLLISFLALVATAVIIVGIGLAIISTFTAQFNHIMQQEIPSLVAVSELQTKATGLIEIARSIQEAKLTHRYERFRLYALQKQQVRDLAAQLPELFNSKLVDSLENSVNNLVVDVGTYVAVSSIFHVDPDRLSEVNGKLGLSQTDFTVQSDNLLARLQRDLGPEIDTVNGATTSLFIFGIVTGALLLIGAIVLGIYLSSAIARPLEQLTFAVDQLRHGKRDVQLSIESQDEIGILAQSFNQMSNELLQTTVSRDYVENILQAMGSVLIVANGQGLIETSNSFAHQLLDYTEAELQGHDVQSLFENLQTFKLNTASTRTLMIKKDGTTIPVTLSRRKVAGSDLVVYNAQDLSEAERMQQQLLEAQSQIEAQFKRGNRIYTMMDLMRRQLNNVFEHGASREELRDYMNILNDEFEKLSVVIKDDNS